MLSACEAEVKQLVDTISTILNALPFNHEQQAWNDGLYHSEQFHLKRIKEQLPLTIKHLISRTKTDEYYINSEVSIVAIAKHIIGYVEKERKDDYKDFAASKEFAQLKEATQKLELVLDDLRLRISTAAVFGFFFGNALCEHNLNVHFRINTLCDLRENPNKLQMTGVGWLKANLNDDNFIRDVVTIAVMTYKILNETKEAKNSKSLHETYCNSKVIAELYKKERFGSCDAPALSDFDSEVIELMCNNYIRRIQWVSEHETCRMTNYDACAYDALYGKYFDHQEYRTRNESSRITNDETLWRWNVSLWFNYEIITCKIKNKDQRFRNFVQKFLSKEDYVKLTGEELCKYLESFAETLPETEIETKTRILEYVAKCQRLRNLAQKFLSKEDYVKLTGEDLCKYLESFAETLPETEIETKTRILEYVNWQRERMPEAVREITYVRRFHELFDNKEGLTSDNLKTFIAEIQPLAD